jgi:hypothetical protein
MFVRPQKPAASSHRNSLLLRTVLPELSGTMKLTGVLGNINAQYANSHVNLPSQVKVNQTED